MATDKKKEVKAANDAFWERFQFVLSINDDIICQRYFRINGFNRDMVHTEEFGNVMDGCVSMIMNDLKYKCFVYGSYVRDEPIKLTGFVKDVSNTDDLGLITNMSIEGDVILSDGTKITKEYFDIPKTDGDWRDDPLEPWEVTFKFSFLIDDKPAYERVWDGSQYQKYVRNSVDLSNSDAYWRDKDQSNLYFSAALAKHMTNGRKDLTWKIIRNICEVLCWSQSEYENQSTTKGKYGDKVYAYRPYNKQFVDEWRSFTAQKTRKYFNMIEKSEKYKNSGGLSDGEWNYIERYL